MNIAKLKYLVIVICWHWLLPAFLFARQDDVEINLREQGKIFGQDPGLGYLSGASSEVRLGRYLGGERHHVWRGGVEGDVSLINFADRGIWHFGLSMETLADDLNDINFRLVQVYYQALTGIKWKLGRGVVHIGYRHRCSHGADGAEDSRITIKSGPTADYHWSWRLQKNFAVAVKSGLNYYLLGQDRNLLRQPLGNAFLSAQSLITLNPNVVLVMSAGLSLQLWGRGHRVVYAFSRGVGDLQIEPLLSTRVAMRIGRGRLKNDIGIHFAQNFDSGIGLRSSKTNSLAFIIDFFW